ncbi:MAG: DUF4040 domain-containing protein [Aphanocapsa sp. GSE-SYN-MK-11-07L]|jgi:putative multicomponent Na+:H+ antiporter subunit B|nr:DUF4040 domain-containing protein [Aphanocapsa sp. GSE-SYN-MK-11-07L]
MDSYIFLITALLPLAAAMVILQTNPYRALVMRGILGAIAALVYTILGAADVALTEALVGTLLAITLYAVAVRSSLVLRLGVLADNATPTGKNQDTPQANQFKQLVADLQTIFGKRQMRVELVPYQQRSDLQQALIDKEVHATCIPSTDPEALAEANSSSPYQTTTRLRRLYEIMQPELVASTTTVSYASPSNPGEAQL